MLKLEVKPKTKIGQIPLVKKMIKNKYFCSLIVGNNQSLNLNQKVSFYLPKIGSGYANAKVKDVLNMNIINAYT